MTEKQELTEKINKLNYIGGMSVALGEFVSMGAEYVLGYYYDEKEKQYIVYENLDRGFQHIILKTSDEIEALKKIYFRLRHKENAKKRNQKMQNLMAWEDDTGGTHIYSDNRELLVMGGDRTWVFVYDKDYNKIAEIRNTEDIQLMYLIRHKKYGACVVASIKKDEKWTDVYLTLQDGKFIEVGKAY